MRIASKINSLKRELSSGVKLVAVSKFHPVQALMEAYDAGQRAFAESRPQEFAAKVPLMPADVEWHFIGHLQTNKLKLVLPYASMLQSVDSVHLLEAVSSWCMAAGKRMDVLLELKLGAEETKHGLSEEEIFDIMRRAADYAGVRIRGLMGMATNTDDAGVIKGEFLRMAELKRRIAEAFPDAEGFDELSIGMSSDYRIALEAGSTMVRIGTSIFGPREY